MLLSLVFCFIPRPAWMVASLDRPQMHLLVCRRLFTVGLQKGAHNGSNCRALMLRLRRCCSPLRPPSRVFDTAAPPRNAAFSALPAAERSRRRASALLLALLFLNAPFSRLT